MYGMKDIYGVKGGGNKEKLNDDNDDGIGAIKRGSIKDRVSMFNARSESNPHFKGASVRNNLVDLVAKEDLEIKIDFDAAARKYGLDDDGDDGDDDELLTAAPAAGKARKAAAVEEKEKEQAAAAALEYDGPYLKAPEGTPKPGASLKVEPLGSLEFAFDEVYKLGDELNSGAFGTVYKGYHVMTGPKAEVAIKVVDRQSINDDVNDAEVLLETEVMRQLRQFDHIVRLFDFYMSDEKFYVVQELAAGGDVFDRLVERKTYTESDARDLSRILLETIQTLHSKHLLHRDLKPENLLLKNVQNDTGILLCDFGFAKYIPSNGNGYLSTHCGTPAYASPEIVNGVQYRSEVDMWSIGCIIFMLLCGVQPFDIEDPTELYDAIAEGDWQFGYNDTERALWDKVTKEAKDLITNLMELDPRKRFCALEALDHPWFTTCAKFKLKKTKLDTAVKNVKTFNQTKKKATATHYIDKNYIGDSDCLYVGPTKEELARLKKLRMIQLYRPEGKHLD